MQARYSSAQQTMHWLTVLLMFSVLPVAWVLVSVTEETPIFFFWMDVHELIGLSILALTTLRIVWRFFDPPPSYPTHLAPWSRRIARVVHFGLLTTMVVMPISGFIWATGHGHDVAPFDLVRFPRIEFNHRAVGDAASAVHQYCQWFVYGLIALHLTGVSYHLIFKRDAILGRMLPPQALETAQPAAIESDGCIHGTKPSQ
jgi:cytochrome b561